MLFALSSSACGADALGRDAEADSPARLDGGGAAIQGAPPESIDTLEAAGASLPAGCVAWARAACDRAAACGATTGDAAAADVLCTWGALTSCAALYWVEGDDDARFTRCVDTVAEGDCFEFLGRFVFDGVRPDAYGCPGGRPLGELCRWDGDCESRDCDHWGMGCGVCVEPEAPPGAAESEGEVPTGGDRCTNLFLRAVDGRCVPLPARGETCSYETETGTATWSCERFEGLLCTRTATDEPARCEDREGKCAYEYDCPTGTSCDAPPQSELGPLVLGNCLPDLPLQAPCDADPSRAPRCQPQARCLDGRCQLAPIELAPQSSSNPACPSLGLHLTDGEGAEVGTACDTHGTGVAAGEIVLISGAPECEGGMCLGAPASDCTSGECDLDAYCTCECRERADRPACTCPTAFTCGPAGRCVRE